MTVYPWGMHVVRRSPGVRLWVIRLDLAWQRGFRLISKSLDLWCNRAAAASIGDHMGTRGRLDKRGVLDSMNAEVGASSAAVIDVIDRRIGENHIAYV
jgi:hypothetical protein